MDTANPQWMLNQVTALKDLGRQNEAIAQFQKIVDDNWAPGFKNRMDQTKALLE